MFGHHISKKLSTILNILICISLLAEVSPLAAFSQEMKIAYNIPSPPAQKVNKQPTQQQKHIPSPNQPAVQTIPTPTSIPTTPTPTPIQTSSNTKHNLSKITKPASQIDEPITTISLIPGWNLHSTPLQDPNPDPNNIFAPITGQYNVAYAYQACNTTEPWQVFDPDTPPATNDLTTVTPNIGYWIQATTTATLPLDGTLPPTTTIPLCTGWNLIGMPTPQARPVRNALFSIDGKYTRVFGYNAANPENPWAVFDANAPAWANDLQMMNPGQGYWILATENVTLTIANQGPLPIATLLSPYEHSTEIIPITFITDVIGTAASSLLAQWNLSYRAQGEANWVEFATGTTPCANRHPCPLRPHLTT